MASARTSVWEKAALPALLPITENSVSPHMSLLPFRLLPQHRSSEPVILSKCVGGPFKRNCLGFRQFLSSTASIPMGFPSQKLWGLVFQTLEIWAGGLVWGWDPGSSGKTSAAETPFPIFICNTWVWDQPVPSQRPDLSVS